VRLAAQYFEREEHDRAREVCLSGIDLYPTYSTAYYILAKIFARQSDFTSAHESIQRAISLNPTATTFLQFRTEIEVQLYPTVEPLPDVLHSAESELTEETESVHVAVEELETPDEETGLEEITELPFEEIPGFDEPEIPEQLEEQATIEDISETVAEAPSFTGVSSTDNFLEEPTAQPPEQEGEIVGIKTFDPDVPVTVEQSVDQLVASSKDITQTESPEVEPAVSATSLIDTTTEITLESVELETIAPEETVTDSTATAELTSQIDIQEEELVKAQRMEDGRIVSKTLAEIFASQGEYQEAIITYTLLKHVRPNLSVEIEARIGELEILQREKTG